ncbi:hypothetical protein, partial [Enterobacter cloacae]|uniref:hypothetical protein n=1 Tax=Enterobacter cloacae TaxID=550 RepID=UPI0034D5A82B
ESRFPLQILLDIKNIHSDKMRWGRFLLLPKYSCKQSYPQILGMTETVLKVSRVNSISVTCCICLRKFDFKMLLRSLDLISSPDAA